MKVQKSEYCNWCFVLLGTAEPRRHRIVGNPEGGLEEESYHIPCFHLLELKELILKEARKSKQLTLPLKAKPTEGGEAK